jgi:hypothetical protein
MMKSNVRLIQITLFLAIGLLFFCSKKKVYDPCNCIYLGQSFAELNRQYLVNDDSGEKYVICPCDSTITYELKFKGILNKTLSKISIRFQPNEKIEKINSYLILYSFGFTINEKQVVKLRYNLNKEASFYMVAQKNPSGFLTVLSIY